MRVLREHRRLQLEDRLRAGPAYADQGLVFASSIGTPLEVGTISRHWAQVVRVAAIGPIRWHDLRHAHPTLLLRRGIHPKVISERLGHARVSITLDTYSHVLPVLEASAALALDAMLAEPEVAEAR